MKKFLVVFCSMVLGVFILTGMVQAADKLGYVNLGRVFNEYSKTKDYDKSLTDKENSYIAERDKKLADFNSLKDKYALLSDKEKEAKRGELETKAKTIKDFVTQKEADLRKEQEDKMKEILKDIDTAVKSNAEKEGYTMILDNRGTTYAAKSVDITDKIVDALNKKK